MSEQGIATYCLGTGCMEKCTTCKHVHNWDMLNQLPDALRLSIQRAAKRMDQTYCQISSGRLYEPMTGGPAA